MSQIKDCLTKLMNENDESKILNELIRAMPEFRKQLDHNELEKQIDNIKNNKELQLLIRDYFLGEVKGNYSEEKVKDVITQTIRNTK